MKSSGSVIFLTIVILSFVACTERIEVRLDESYVRLVVEGAVTTDTMVHSVYLSKTTSYFYGQKPPHVTGAYVTITSGGETYLLNEEIPGVYQTHPLYHGIPGQKYTLNITLASPVGGHIEYTASSTLSPVILLDSIDLAFQPQWSDNGLWEVRCYLQDPPATNYYRFLVSRNDNLMADTLNEWFVTDDRFVNGSYANGVTVAYLEQGADNESLIPGDVISVELNSIGKEYAGFLWEAQAELRGSNPLFSGPSANIKGNISNGAIGFFAAYSVSRAYTTVEY